MIRYAEDMKNVQKLVGGITEEDLRYVDCYISDNLSMFIPSVGYCQYAIQFQHTHPAYSFVLYFSPEQCMVPVEIEMQTDHYLVTAISPDVPHEEKQLDTFKRYIAILISRQQYESIYASYSQTLPGRYEWEQFLISHDIMSLLKRFMIEYENKQSGYRQVMEALAVVITHQFIRSKLKTSDSIGVITGRFEIERVIEYMQQNYEKKLSVAKLAALINRSESHFTRIFKKETGLSPLDYLIKVRLDKAKKLLRSEIMSITLIALQCGFNSVSHFSSCFVKRQGMTPTQYQNHYSKQDS